MAKCNTVRTFDAPFINLLKIDKSGGGIEWAACERIEGSSWGEPSGPIAQAYDGLFVFEEPEGTIRLVNYSGFNSWVTGLDGGLSESSSFPSSGSPFIFQNPEGAAITDEYLWLGQQKFSLESGAYIKTLELAWSNTFNRGAWNVENGGESFDYISNFHHLNRWDDETESLTINNTDLTFRQSPNRNRTLLSDGSHYYPWYTDGLEEGIAQVAIGDLSVVDTFVDNSSGFGAGSLRQSVRAGLLVYATGTRWSLIDTSTMTELWRETGDWGGFAYSQVTGVDCCSTFAVATGTPPFGRDETIVARDLNGDLLWEAALPFVHVQGLDPTCAHPVISQNEELVYFVGSIAVDQESTYNQAIAALDATNGAVVWSLRHVGGPRRGYSSVSDWGINLIESGSSIYLAKRSSRGPTYR